MKVGIYTWYMRCHAFCRCLSPSSVNLTLCSRSEKHSSRRPPVHLTSENPEEDVLIGVSVSSDDPGILLEADRDLGRSHIAMLATGFAYTRYPYKPITYRTYNHPRRPVHSSPNTETTQTRPYQPPEGSTTPPRSVLPGPSARPLPPCLFPVDANYHS
jgi:hypothetical protein